MDTFNIVLNTEYIKNPQLFLLNSVKDAIRKIAEQVDQVL